MVACAHLKVRASLVRLPTPLSMPPTSAEGTSSTSPTSPYWQCVAERTSTAWLGPWRQDLEPLYVSCRSESSNKSL